MPPSSKLPATLDRIEVLVLIDNKTDSLSTVPANFVNEWQNLKEAGMEQLSGSCQCCANHGLALIIRAWRGDRQHTMLFDAGPVDFAVEYNGSRLGAAFGEIDAIRSRTLRPLTLTLSCPVIAPGGGQPTPLCGGLGSGSCPSRWA